MHPSSAGDVLSVENLGPIAKAEIDFGDLTVLVGPQASGKSILLQTLKLQLDALHIATRLRLYGFTWDETDHETFLELYFGEGLGGLWSDKTQISWNGKATAVKDLMSLTREDAGGPMFPISRRSGSWSCRTGGPVISRATAPATRMS